MDHVGIDLHKHESQICVMNDIAEVTQELRIKTSRESFTQIFGERSPCRILLEASGESEWVARVLEALGHEVVVAHPGYEAMYAGRNRKVKTDKRDARALAEALVKGIFRRAHRKSDEQRLCSARLTVREALVRTRAKIIVVAKAFLRSFGFRVRTGAAERFVPLLEELELPQELQTVLAPILALLPSLGTQIDTVDAELAQLSKNDERARRLQSVPSIGPVTSMAFIATIDNASRFESSRQVAAYIGLVPSEYSSGEKQKKGHITKAGNSQIRSLLVQAALRMRRTRAATPAPLREWAAKVAARRGGKLATVALARKLSTILFAILRDGTVFHMPPTPEGA